MGARPAAGGGRWVEVDPERLSRWLDGFAERHGAPVASMDGDALVLDAPDGEQAWCEPPPGAPPAAGRDDFVAAANQPRRIGLLLVRRGGVAVGVAEGTALVAHKVDGAYVQSRTAAGGWSQQRFARRRDNQAAALTATAADHAVRLLTGLDVLVTGGDRRLVEAVLADPRLETQRPARHLDVPDPRFSVLEAAVRGARAVRIRLRR